jgi:hypothetical protein
VIDCGPADRWRDDGGIGVGVPRRHATIGVDCGDIIAGAVVDAVDESPTYTVDPLTASALTLALISGFQRLKVPSVPEAVKPTGKVQELTVEKLGMAAEYC